MNPNYHEGNPIDFSSLLSLLSIAVFIADDKGQIIFCNKACVTALGPLERNPFAYARTSANGLYDFMGVCREVLMGKQPERALVTISHPDTHKTACFKLSAKLFSEKYVLFTAIDHTEKVKLEQLIEEKKEQFFSIMSSLGDLVFKIDHKGYVTKIWSLAPPPSSPFFSIAEGIHLSECFPSSIADTLASAIVDVVDTSVASQVEFCCSNGGSEQWFSSQISLVKPTSGVREVIVITKETTEEKKNQQRSAYKSRLIHQLTSIKDGPLLHVIEGDPPKYNFISGNLFSITRYTEDELIAKDWLNLIHEDDRETVLSNIRELKSEPQRTHVDLVYRIESANGDTKWVNNHISKTDAEAGEVLIGVILNVTELHLLHDKLKQRDRILTNTSKVALIGGWEFDLKNNRFNLTEEIYRIHERDPAKFEIEKSPDYYIEEHQPIIKQYLEDLIQKGKNFDDELLLLTGKGNQKWIRTVGCAEWNNGQITHIYGIIQDIDQKKKQELILEDNERRFNAAFELAPLGIGLLSLSGHWLRINTALTHFFELPKDQLIDIPMPDLKLTNGASKSFDMDWISQHPDKTHQWEQTYLTESGKTKWGRFSISAAKNEQGEVLYFILQVVDITERKHYERKLIAARKEAEKANRIKSDFLSTMTHEIRTPLSGVIGITNLLLDEIKDPAHLEQLRALKFSSDSLLLLVNDILDFSKIRSGVLSLESKPFNLKRVVEAIEELNSPRATEKSNQIVIKYDQDLAIDYIGDELRIGQILNNLVHNAVKFTQNGLIVIGVKKMDSVENKHQLLFSVEDTGIGIPYDKQSSIFEQFTQADPSISRRYGGTGLGLSIVKGLTEAMGGRTHLVSEPSKGTTISFELQLEVANTGPHLADLDKQEAKDLQGKTILLVEDNPVSMLVSTQYLKKWNAHVIQAVDGQKAVEQYFENHEKIDLVLMDINIPLLNGYETAVQIKKVNASVPIVAVTASTDENVKLRNLVQAYLFKPFDTDDFYRTVKEHIK